jgi:hypothetical protein
MGSDYFLRDFDARDGQGLATLGEQTPDSGAISFRSTYHFDPYATISATYPGVIGVVAVSPGREGLVGSGMMSTGNCWYEGAIHPFAYLFGIGVHPDFRLRGMATEIYNWLVSKAKEELGSDVVIFANIQQGNEGSLRAAKKWCSQVVMERTTVKVVRMRTTAPSQIQGLEVRPAEENDWEEIAEKQNAYYQEHNFYPQRSAQDLISWNTLTPFGFSFRDYFVVVDKNRDILAGLSATEEGKIITSEVTRMPVPLKLVNRFLKMIPADGIVKRIHVKDAWVSSGNIHVGAYLWEQLRWFLRDRGTSMMVFVDKASLLADAIPQPRIMPSNSDYIALAAPKPLMENRYIYLHV